MFVIWLRGVHLSVGFGFEVNLTTNLITTGLKVLNSLLIVGMQVGNPFGVGD
jgi:hypothetical protein